MAPGDQIEFDPIPGRGQVLPKHLYEYQYLYGWKIERSTGRRIGDGWVLCYSARRGPNFVPFNFKPPAEDYEMVIKYWIGTQTIIAKVVGHRDAKNGMNDQIEY